MEATAVGIAVAVPWRYGDDEAVVNWLLPLVKGLVPDADAQALQRICSLKWCYLA